MTLPPQIERRNSICRPEHLGSLLLRQQDERQRTRPVHDWRAQGLRAAEIRREKLHEIRIEVILADQKTEFVAQARLPIV
jgi:hypothetical protein